MRSKRLVWALALAFLAAAAPGPAQEEQFETVTLSYLGGDSCIAIDKPIATIYRNKNPKMVKWSVADSSRYWEIRYQESSPDNPNKRDGAGDYFRNSDRLDIKCAQNDVRTVIPDVQVPAYAHWPYKITVYSCDGMNRGQLLCELDPGVDWGD